MTLRIRLVYAACIVLLASATILIAEFLVLPGVLGVPRGTFLMGFAATPNQLVDDTPINSMGFTGDVIEVEKTPGTTRILTLGGSAFFNRRMTDRLIEALGAASAEPVEVVGAALRTHTTLSSVFKYDLLSRYDFDVVIIYHGVNDLWANHVMRFRPDYFHLSPWYKRSRLLDRSVIYRLIYNKWIYSGSDMVRNSNYLKANQAGFAAEHTFRQNMTTLVDAIRRDASVPILMTFASSIPAHYSQAAFESRSLGYNNPTDYDRCSAEVWGAPDFVREGLRKHNRIINEISASKQVLLLDQERLVGKDLRWFGDVCHFSEEGTDRFIRNIVEFLAANGLLSTEASAAPGVAATAG